MNLVFSKEFQQMLKERANEERTTIPKYIMYKMIEIWQAEGYSFDKETMVNSPRDHRYTKLYEKNGIICSQGYDYEFCKKVMDMYHAGGSSRSIAKDLGKHQKTIWRIIDRNVNKSGE